MVEVVRAGQPAPGTPYNFTSVAGNLYNHGQMLIGGEVGSGNVHNDSVIYRRSIAGNLVKIAASLESAPHTSRTFGWISSVGDMSETGEVVFYAYLTNSAGVQDGSGIFKGRDAASLKPIAFSGHQAPGGVGAFTAFDSSVGINSAGKVSFVGY